MLNVKKGKIAKINSCLTPEERDDFFGMITEAFNKLEFKKEMDSDNEITETKDKCEEDLDKRKEETEYTNETDSKEEFNQTEEIEETKETEELDTIDEHTNEKDSRKEKAENLIKEFSNFINSIS